jgi:hypothetical protein
VQREHVDALGLKATPSARCASRAPSPRLAPVMRTLFGMAAVYHGAARHREPPLPAYRDGLSHAAVQRVTRRSASTSG